jgi:hypothetical protein
MVMAHPIALIRIPIRLANLQLTRMVMAYLIASNGARTIRIRLCPVCAAAENRKSIPMVTAYPIAMIRIQTRHAILPMTRTMMVFLIVSNGARMIRIKQSLAYATAVPRM